MKCSRCGDFGILFVCLSVCLFACVCVCVCALNIVLQHNCACMYTPSAPLPLLSPPCPLPSLSPPLPSSPLPSCRRCQCTGPPSTNSRLPTEQTKESCSLKKRTGFWCVRACVRACMHACMRACVCVACVWCVHVCACILVQGDIGM